MRRACHIGCGAEFRILFQIGNDDHVVGEDDAGAEGEVARAFGKLHARFAGNAQPVLIDDVDGGIGHCECILGELGKCCKLRRRAAADGAQRAHGKQSLRFVDWNSDRLPHSDLRLCQRQGIEMALLKISARAKIHQR